MTGNKYRKYYPKVEAQKKNFEYLIECIKESDDYDDKIRLSNFALRYATYHNTGYFTSSFLENFYTGFAKKIDLDNYDINYKPNSFLHVMTRGYLRGGHTRVVERWIENAPKNEKHSVIFTTPNNENMELIEKLTADHNGECIYLNKSWRLIERALKLRRIGLEYQYIVLHTHMEDPIPTIAFGTEKFTRPVIFYNHASHMFWLGKSIADLVLDLRSDDDITKRLKGIKNSFPIGVPSKKITFTKSDKTKLRKKLNLPLDKKIIVSSGSDFKYLPICDDNFYNIFSEIIDENTYCYLIGPDMEKWEHIYKNSNKHIIPLGYINFNDGYMDYIRAADLYLDSYPLCSATAVIDAVSAGTPALSLDSVYPPVDYLSKTSAFCITKEEYIKKAKMILNDKKSAKANVEELQASLIKYQSKDAWNKNIQKMLKLVPDEHSVKIFDEKEDINEINDLAVYINVITDRSFTETDSSEQFDEKTIQNILTYKQNPIKVSIIVPVYNAEKYLKDCINSLINQTLRDIEIIIVDDCSTDNSLSILEEYEKQDNRIVLIKQKKNCGQGCARNLALEIARGDYIMFLDSDDWYEPNACETAYNQISENKNEICLFRFYNCYEKSGTKRLYTEMTDAYNELINEKNIRLSDLKTNYIRSMFSVMFIYKREFLNVNNIRYSDDRLGEDVIFLSKVYTLINTLSIIQTPLYNRRMIEASDKSSGSSLDTVKWSYIFKVRRDGLNYITKSKNEYVLKAYIIYCIRSVMYWYRTYSKINENIIPEYYGSMQTFFREIDNMYPVKNIAEFIDYSTYEQALTKKWQEFDYKF